MSQALMKTIGDEQWMREHQAAIKAILPETWTHIANIDPLKMGFQLKLLGVDWRSKDEFGKCMAYFHAVGLMQRDCMLFRRAP